MNPIQAIRQNAELRAARSENEDLKCINQWNALMLSFLERGYSKADALKLAIRADGDLHRDYLRAYTRQSARDRARREGRAAR